MNFDGKGVRIGEGETEIPVLVDDETVTIDEGAILLFKVTKSRSRMSFDSESRWRTSIPIVVKDIAIRSIPLEGSKLWKRNVNLVLLFKMLGRWKACRIDNLPYTIYRE